MNAILSFFLIPWVVYSILTVAVLVAYGLIHGDNHCEDSAALVSVLALAYATYVFEPLRSILLSWPGALWVVLGYLVAGFVVAGIKWLLVLTDFKVRAGKWLKEQNTFTNLKGTNQQNILNEMGYCLYDNRYSNKIAASNGSYYPNWRGFPVANWVLFFPFFTFSVAFEPISRFVKYVLAQAGALIERVSKLFSVSNTQ